MKKILISMLALFAIATTASAQNNTIDGHEYVDLGLPSGTLWATCNVGATSPEEYGDHFAWGETQPKKDYSWETYKWCKGTYTTLTKYCTDKSYGHEGFTDELITLEAEDDAATANWGEGWRMPTSAEIKELLDNTESKGVTQNGVNGRLFTAANGNSIFLPASGGYRSGGSLNYVGSGGGYWSSSLLGGIPADAYCLYFLYFDSGNVDRGNDDRSCGQCVRPVINKRNIASEYVDLGLPSGVKWATCNVGATSPEEYGEYFAWGETTKKDTYSWETYVLCDGSYNTLTKYCNASKYGKDGFTDELTTLQSADDAATANWGEGWRTPTQAEFEELVANTKSKWTTLNGVNGYEFTAENGNSIFLPAVSHIDNTTLNNSGESGIYWTASLWSLPQHADNPSIAFFMDFNSSEVATTFGTNRCFGMNIRPVFGENQTPTGIEYNSRETLNNSHYYSIDGKRLSGEPTKKGVYIVNGRKVVK